MVQPYTREEFHLFENVINEAKAFDGYLKNPTKTKYTLNWLNTMTRGEDEIFEMFKEEFKKELKNRFGDITNFDKISFSRTSGFFTSNDARQGYIQFWIKNDIESPDPEYFKKVDTRFEANKAFVDEVENIVNKLLERFYDRKADDDNFYAYARTFDGGRDYSQLITIDIIEVRDGEIRDRYQDSSDDEFKKLFTQPLIKYGVAKYGKVLNKIAQEKGWSSWDDFANSKRFDTWQNKQDHGNSDRRASIFAKNRSLEDLVEADIHDEFRDYHYEKDKSLEDTIADIKKKIDWHSKDIEANRRSSIFHYTALPTKTEPKPASERKPRTKNPDNIGKKYYVRMEYSENGEYWDDKYGPYTAEEARKQYDNFNKEYEYAISQGTVAITLENRLGRELQPNELKESIIFDRILDGDDNE